jgi:NAD+ synthetase
MRSLKVSLAQLNPIIADFDGNVEKVLNAMRASNGADIQVFPELTLSGYSPMDLMFELDFMYAQYDAFNRVLKESLQYPNTVFVIGLITKRPMVDVGGKSFHNSAIAIKNGDVIMKHDKRLLPTYDVFDERRYFEPGYNNMETFHVNGFNVAMVICEDAWNEEGASYEDNPVSQIAGGCDMLITLNASPAGIDKLAKRMKIYTDISTKYKIPVVYVNQVGGNDQVVFDGASFVVNGNQMLTAKSNVSGVSESTFNADSGEWEDADNLFIPDSLTNKVDFILDNITLGLKDYMAKTGFSKVVIGCSGGIDSAVTIALAAKTIGSENVVAVTMPSKISSQESISDSDLLCRQFGVKLYELPIAPMVESECMQFEAAFGMPVSGIALENLQARIRGVSLMTYANQTGALLLTTGNKSELSVGYATLYGDMAGGLNLIGDLYKMEVYAIARALNIPVSIIDKEPSAELAEGQKDRDSLPEYPRLDCMLKFMLERDAMSVDELNLYTTMASEEQGKKEIEKVKALLHKSEFKRRQAAPVIRCRTNAFGFGRQYPIASKMV